MKSEGSGGAPSCWPAWPSRSVRWSTSIALKLTPRRRAPASPQGAGVCQPLGSRLGMARQLWLLRHGDAEPHGMRPDSERQLPERGIAQSRAAGVALQRLGVDFELVLYSPKARARETAEVAAEAWSGQQRARMSPHPPLASGYGAPDAPDALPGLGA